MLLLSTFSHKTRQEAFWKRPGCCRQLPRALQDMPGVGSPPEDHFAVGSSWLCTRHITCTRLTHLHVCIQTLGRGKSAHSAEKGSNHLRYTGPSAGTPLFLRAQFPWAFSGQLPLHHIALAGLQMPGFLYWHKNISRALEFKSIWKQSVFSPLHSTRHSWEVT